MTLFIFFNIYIHILCIQVKKRETEKNGGLGPIRGVTIFKVSTASERKFGELLAACGNWLARLDASLSCLLGGEVSKVLPCIIHSSLERVVGISLFPQPLAFQPSNFCRNYFVGFPQVSARGVTLVFDSLNHPGSLKACKTKVSLSFCLPSVTLSFTELATWLLVHYRHFRRAFVLLERSVRKPFSR